MKKQISRQKLNLKDIQEISYGILKEFKYFCDSNGLKYYLAYGTLIGAIRHNGFIPWDDDIDVFMPRPDYEKLLKLYKDNANYQLYSPRKQRDYYCCYMKLVDANTYHLMPDGSVCSRGVDIDIFALDGQPSDFSIAKANFEKVFKKYENFSLRMIRYRYDAKGGAANVFKRMLAKVLISSGIIAKLSAYFDEQYSYYDYDMATCVAPSNANMSEPFGVWSKSLFEPCIQVKFEKEEFSVPIGYDEILSSYYGDYMKLPSEDKRISTHSEEYFRKNVMK